MSVSGTLQEDLRNLKPNEFSFIDVCSEKPLVVIGNQIFSGEYQVRVSANFGGPIFIKGHLTNKNLNKYGIFTQNGMKKVEKFKNLNISQQ